VVEVENVITSHWRIAAGAWLLAVSLVLSAGAAAAFADPGSDATKDADGASTASSAAAQEDAPAAVGAEKQRPHPAGSEPTATPDRRDVSGESPAPRTQTSPGRVGWREVATAAGGEPAPNADPAPTADPAPQSEAGQTNAPVPPSDAPPTSAPAAASDPPPTPPTTVEAVAPAAPSHDPAVPVTTAADPEPPAPTAVADPSGQVEQVTNQDAPSPTETVAVPAVVTPSEDTVTSTEVETVTQLAADTAPSLGTAVTEAQPITDVVNAKRRSPSLRTVALSPLHNLRFLSGTSGRGWAGSVTADPSEAQTAITAPSAIMASGTTAALAEAASTSMAARVAPNAELPEGLRVFLRSYGQLIIAASLSAMAAAALPGLAGIVIPTLAAVRIGYRQAKAGQTLHASGIARFSGSGPLGVVRSGSVVAVRAHRSRVARPVGADRSEGVA
jgi:hypothetical protein